MVRVQLSSGNQALGTTGISTMAGGTGAGIGAIAGVGAGVGTIGTDDVRTVGVISNGAGANDGINGGIWAGPEPDGDDAQPASPRIPAPRTIHW